MHLTLICFLSVAVLFAVTAFLRERRLRLALQKLIRCLFSRRRSSEFKKNTNDDSAGDGTHAPDGLSV